VSVFEIGSALEGFSSVLSNVVKSVKTIPPRRLVFGAAAWTKKFGLEGPIRASKKGGIGKCNLEKSRTMAHDIEGRVKVLNTWVHRIKAWEEGHLS